MTGTLTVWSTLTWVCSIFCVGFGSTVPVSVAVAIYRNRQLRNGSFSLILQLTVTQVVKAWCYLLLIIAKNTDFNYQSNVILFCKLEYFVWSVTDHTAFAILTAIAIDRYSNIVHPLKAMTTSAKFRKRAPYLAWASSIVLSFLYTFTAQRSTEGEVGLDINNASRTQFGLCIFETGALPKAFSLTYILTGFIGPVVISAYCYLWIARTIWKRRVLSHTKTSSLERSKVKIIKMSFVVLLLFVFTYAPIAIGNVFEAYGIVRRTYTVKKFIGETVSMALLCLGSVSIPVIYAWFSREFRQSFKEVFCCATLRRIFHMNSSNKALWEMKQNKLTVRK